MIALRGCLRAAVIGAALLLVASCDQIFGAKSPFHGIDVTGAPMGGELRLADTDGRTRTLADFRGKVLVVAFGYTQCPDVCPTTLADLAATMKRMGAEAANVQVLFVTLDPKRDTAELLKQYVDAFDSRFIALHGDATATAQVVKDFRIYSAERPGKTPESYTVEHSSQMFALDRQGRVRLVLAYGTKPEDIASDLKILLNS